jgi:hypothetical protein
MGFKMKGPSMHSGTAKHRSALKAIESVEARKQSIAAAGQASASGEASASPAKQKAYGGTKTWAQGQEDSGGTLNDITKGQRAYEKEMKAKDPKWNKREDNKWKKTQNKINAALGSTKVYDVTKDIATKNVDRDGDGTKETEVMRGIGSNKGKTLTTTEKSAEKANISTQRDIVKKSKEEKKLATTKEGKNTAKNKRDEAQKEIGEIRGGRDDKYTGTVVSRWLGKRKAKRNQRQLDRREEKNSPTKLDTKSYKEAGVSTTKAKDWNKSSAGKAYKKKSSPTKIIGALAGMAGKAILGKVAGKVAGKVMGEKKEQ